ncbi:ACT domain-containing protein, partial [Chloroflexota bacterium]
PSLDWLNPNLGYVRTSHAMQKIKQWFRKQERVENIEHGRELLDRELRHLGLEVDRQLLAEMFGYGNTDDFLAAIGSGIITAHQIALKLAAQQGEQKIVTQSVLPRTAPSSVRVLGVGDLVTNLAQCCHPVPGDKIVGYITRSRGVTIHRQDCYNITNEDEKERLVSAEWEDTDALYRVDVQVEAWDRVGLMRDITTVVAEEKVNIASVSFADNRSQTILMYLAMETKGLTQLSRLLKRIETVRGVVSVTRIGDEASKNA